MLLRKFFENSLAVMAILVLFEQFSGKILFKFFDPYSECIAKHDASCLHITFSITRNEAYRY